MTSHCTEFVFVCFLLWTRAEFPSSKLICPSQLCNCTDNSTIDCRYKRLKTIPKFIPSNTTFYKLDFFEDQRFSILEFFQYLIYEVLFNNRNDISTLDLESFKNIRVEQIDLRSVRLTHIDSKAFAGLEQFLKVLYIEGDGRPVVNLPFLKGLMTLEWLHLENFGLTDVSEDNPWKELTSLKMIRVKGCINLTSLGNNTFVNMPNLATVYLENLPSLQTVPTAIQNLQSLMNLTFYKTSISLLDENSFKGLRNLIKLNLSMNQIVDVEVGSFLPTPNLTDLDLHDQHQVHSCQSLHSSGYTQLNLPHEAFWHLRFHLTHLDLSYNLINLTDTYELIRSLSNLKVLGLRCIGLTEIPSYLFSNHSTLQMLYMENNNLKKLSQPMLYGLSDSLRALYLNNNKLKTLYKCVLENFTQLQKLELKQNEWICDCHVLWLYDKIHGGSFERNIVMCTTPTNHKSRYLSDLKRSMLVCNDDYFQSDCPIWLDLNITTLSQTSLQLNWSVSDEYLLSGYLLEVTNLQKTTSTIKEFHDYVNYYTLTELEPGTPYQICLLIMISDTVKANLEVCKTWKSQSPFSSNEIYQEETTSRTIIFKSLIAVGAFGFVIIVLAITVILKNVSKRKTGISMQLVLTEQYTSGCLPEAAISNSSGILDSMDGHFLKHNNMLSIYPELNPVEHKKLRERCKHLLSTASKSDAKITYLEVLRSEDDTCSPNMSETEEPQTRSSIIYTEVDTSLNPSSQTWDNNDETIKSFFINTTVSHETQPGCQTTEMYSEINESTMDHDITEKGSKSDISILNKTESMTGEATLTSIPVHLVSSRQRSFNVNTNIPASKKIGKKRKTKVGGLKTWARKKRSKSNEGQTDKEVEDEGKEVEDEGKVQFIPLSDSESKKDPGAELRSTNNINSNYITMTGTSPKISQKSKLYIKPTKSENDDNDFNTFS
ncbi:hypothetical protein ACJMK2_031750 [Sinanodonta woodiana]|uniref:LRRCT domain-containing protein n=1 Tax=Sinanodonta woodiana TaxID=1069815 RepID=A0ABD3WZQ2_SINWO